MRLQLVFMLKDQDQGIVKGKGDNSSHFSVCDLKEATPKPHQCAWQERGNPLRTPWWLGEKKGNVVHTADMPGHWRKFKRKKGQLHANRCGRHKSSQLPHYTSLHNVKENKSLCTSGVWMSIQLHLLYVSWKITIMTVLWFTRSCFCEDSSSLLQLGVNHT